jgi:hypothetical protein
MVALMRKMVLGIVVKEVWKLREGGDTWSGVQLAQTSEAVR